MAMYASPIRLIDCHVARPSRENSGEFEYLALKRSAGKIYSGQWRIVTGKVEQSEFAWQAARREVKEETQFDSFRFFVVPFIIAIFGVLIFLMLRILTIEPRTAQDYLHDVKIGGNTKRWQGAFELSKILANPAMVPKEERFVNDLISTFEYSEKERDNRIRIYLALAMGRTKDLRYATILEKTLNDENEEILAAVIYSLGLINSQTSLEQLLSLIHI